MKQELLNYIDKRLEDTHTQGSIGLLMVRQWVVDNVPETKWIPVSERQPRVGETVLVTIRGTDFIAMEIDETLEEALERNRKIVYVSTGFLGGDGWYGADGYPLIVNPVAWMEMPEPWKGEGK